ncbi:NAD/NADP octopine/nopaline dehydrogenase, partial [Anaerotignum lactatifermentans]|nr:NAD/NADP octopine/nopaline dehydrogenase [Anaerotignum lactatifermentans]MBM6950579.1 NAD/NADP octopine/nopaline dehydrogenase [Anaerotignum lactatifermentans]MBM6952016.1 NAD/NADP octopine/nopaline dehydrogenase [Anaerotignum lactatifermentans]
VIDAMINMANAMLDRDFYADGLTLDDLGIGHMTKEELLDYLNNGVYKA